MKDIVITEYSVFTLGDDWRRKSVTQPSQVEEILQTNSYGDPVADKWHASEISSAGCSIPFEKLTQITVEPISLENVSLIEAVKRVAKNYDIKTPIVVRPYRNQKHISLINELAVACDTYDRAASAATPSQWSMSEAHLPSSVSSWSSDAKDRLLTWCRHFTFGSLRLLRPYMAQGLPQ